MIFFLYASYSAGLNSVPPSSSPTILKAKNTQFKDCQRQLLADRSVRSRILGWFLNVRLCFSWVPLVYPQSNSHSRVGPGARAPPPPPIEAGRKWRVMACFVVARFCAWCGWNRSIYARDILSSSQDKIEQRNALGTKGNLHPFSDRN